MKKHLLLTLGLALGATLSFTSCQKEALPEVAAQEAFSVKSVVYPNINLHFTTDLAEFSVDVYWGNLDDGGRRIAQGVGYGTLSIRNIDITQAQLNDPTARDFLEVVVHSYSGRITRMTSSGGQWSNLGHTVHGYIGGCPPIPGLTDYYIHIAAE